MEKFYTLKYDALLVVQGMVQYAIDPDGLSNGAIEKKIIEGSFKANRRYNTYLAVSIPDFVEGESKLYAYQITDDETDEVIALNERADPTSCGTYDWDQMEFEFD